MPGSLISWIEQRTALADGEPNALGSLETFIAGTSTPAVTYADADLQTANPVVLDLGADGRPTVDVFMAAHYYKVICKNAAGATLYTVDGVGSPGDIYAATYGVITTEASALDEVSGFTVTDETFVTMDSTGGASPCVVILPAAADYTKAVTIKNMGTIALAITPNGSDTIDGIAAAYAVAASASPLFRSVTLMSDGVDAWWVMGSVGV
jgi:hypothetical protein